MGAEEGRSSQQVGQVAFQSLQSEQAEESGKWSLPLFPSEKPGDFKGQSEADACVFPYRAFRKNGQKTPTPPMASTPKLHHLEVQALEAFLKHDVALL